MEYQRCFELPECDLGDVIVKAQIRQDSQADWTAGLLYWDPIDGFGVLGCGQDDEIDFNERIVVTFNTLKAVEKVWLTDLFVGESERYSSIQERVAAEDDFEFAMIEFRDGEERSYAPDAHIRFYHDAHIAEATSFNVGQGCVRTAHPSFPIRQIMVQAWRRNRALDRWLDYLLKQGHSVTTMRAASELEIN